MLDLHHIVTYWNNVRSVTMRFLDAFPADQLAFRPVDTVFSARQQFQHLIASQAMFVRGWTTGTWDFPWRDGQWVATDLVDEAFETLPGLRRFYADTHQQAMQFLLALPVRDGSRTCATHVGTLSIDAMALYAIDEEIHHRAQLGIYLRCLGIQPPAFVQRYQDLSRPSSERVQPRD